MLIATASFLVSGREGVATATDSHVTRASIGGGANVMTDHPSSTGIAGAAAGDVLVDSRSAAEGDAKAESYGGSLIADGGAALTTTTVTPTLSATVGAGATVTAAGSVLVQATHYRANAATVSDQIISVDPVTERSGSVSRSGTGTSSGTTRRRGRADARRICRSEQLERRHRRLGARD